MTLRAGGSTQMFSLVFLPSFLSLALTHIQTAVQRRRK